MHVLLFLLRLFCVGLIALYVELVGDMTASDEPFQPPVIANSIGANPNGPTIPGQEPPPNLQLPPTQQTANNSNSTGHQHNKSSQKHALQHKRKLQS